MMQLMVVTGFLTCSKKLDCRVLRASQMATADRMHAWAVGVRSALLKWSAKNGPRDRKQHVKPAQVTQWYQSQAYGVDA